MNAQLFRMALLTTALAVGGAPAVFGQVTNARREVRPVGSGVSRAVKRPVQQVQVEEDVVDPAEPAAPVERRPARREPRVEPMEMVPQQAEEVAPGNRPARRTNPTPGTVIRPYTTDENLSQDVDAFFSDGEGYISGEEGYPGWCGDCRRGFYASGEVLSIWSGGQNVPALVTTSPNGTARAAAGVLPGATVLYGNDDLNTKARAGARARVGIWVTDCHAVEAEYVSLGTINDTYSQTSSALGTPTIARPFFNAGVNAPANDADLVAFNDGRQGIYSGNIRIESSSGFEAASLMLRTFASSHSDGIAEYTAQCMIGYRYARLRDKLVINSSRTSISDTEQLIPINTVFDVRDSFESTNRFMGADFGLYLQCRQNCWTMDFTGRLAVGSLAREVLIDGQTTTNTPAFAAVVAPGGLLAQRTNMGRYRDDEFAILPELGAKLGLDISPLLRLTVGYNFYALTNVARAGEQIDTSLNLTQAGNQPLVGTARPAFNLVDTSYWAHGISFGLEGDF